MARYFATIFVPACFIAFSPLNALGQSDYETRVNPVTGEYERLYTPWKPENLQRDLIQRENDYSQMVGQHRAQRLQMSDQYLNAVMAELRQRAARGNQIIKAGKASLKFQPSGQYSLRDEFLKTVKDPKWRPFVEKFAESSWQEFAAELEAKNLSPNDLADVSALAFVISFEIYKGERPTDAHLRNFRRLIAAAILKNPYIQGDEDFYKQDLAERNGAMAMFAKRLAAQGRPSDAKTLAEIVIKNIWETPAEYVGMTKDNFAHRGELIIAGGKATHLFKFNPNSDAAEKLAKENGYLNAAQNGASRRAFFRNCRNEAATRTISRCAELFRSTAITSLSRAWT